MSKSVNISIVTNSVILGMKMFVYLTTGSPTLFAETIHSATDVFKQLLLKVGEVRAVRKSTELHPFGFGKEKFFWALVASVSVLFLGCGLSIRHGIESLHHPQESGPFSITALVLLTAGGVLELYTCLIALREIKELGGWKVVRTNTTILAVLLEDAIALLGIALALFVALWSKLVGPAPQLDAYVSIGVGVLLGLMAVVLARLNKEVLIDVVDMEVDAEVERIIKEKSGIRTKVLSTIVDSSRCLLFIRVSPRDIPAAVDYARLAEVEGLLKQHVTMQAGKTIDHVYWQFVPAFRKIAA